MRYNSSVEQLLFEYPSTWGGRREGAGRPRGRVSRHMPHVRRPEVSRHRPHHVTVRVTRSTFNLRSQRCFRPIREALAALRGRAGFRVVQFSVQHNHVHLILEARDRATLANGMRALLIRVAKGLNRVMGARGRRFADRYHEHVLRTPTEALNALRYVLGNRAVHLRRWGRAPGAGDAFCSLSAEDLVTAPGSWLLREGWARAGPPE